MNRNYPCRQTIFRHNRREYDDSMTRSENEIESDSDISENVSENEDSLVSENDDEPNYSDRDEVFDNYADPELFVPIAQDIGVMAPNFEENDDVILMIMLFAFTTKLSNVAISKLLVLLSWCKSARDIPESLYFLKKTMQDADDCHYESHSYCNHCLGPVPHTDSICLSPDCVGHMHHSNGLYVIFDMQYNVQLAFDSPDFANLRLYKQQRVKQHEGNIEDIMDGDKWKEHADIYNSMNHYVMGLSTDGVPLFKSSSMSMWPIWLVSYDLDPKIRYKRRYMTLAGVSFGKKPLMNNFLDALVTQITNSYNHPMQIKSNNHILPLTLHVINVIADLPAKATLLNMHQFNGEYGCSTCLAPGILNGRGQSRYYPDNILYPPRTSQNMTDDAREAVETATCVRGIYGPSILSRLPLFDVSADLGSEYMHGCAGVMKKLLSLWFNSDQHAELWCLRAHLQGIDNDILSLHHPSWITRSPCSLTDMSVWNSSDYMNFLLYYGPFVLCHKLPAQYFINFTHFHSMIRILLSSSISPQNLQQARWHCDQFVGAFELLYRPFNTVPNVHYIKHYCDSVQRHGPLWTTSMFPYESANGTLKSLNHARNQVVKSLVNSVTLMNTIVHRMHAKTLVSEEYYKAIERIDPNIAVELVHKVYDANHIVVNRVCVLSSQIHDHVLQDVEINSLRNVIADIIPEEIRFFRKLLWNDISCSTWFNQKRNDSVVSIIHNNIEMNVVIERFAAWRDHVVVYVAPLMSCVTPAWFPSSFTAYLMHTGRLFIIHHTQLRHVKWSMISAGTVYVCSKALHQS
eukprot:Pompholyxophrys_sp_v1_NODE_16_length_4221_cov_20.931109.p1 type:complete len:801 gc:universal NODE_16_length_4221_cov_20.931109:2595-193(-)